MTVGRRHPLNLEFPLYRALESRGLTVNQFATALEVTHQQLSLWINGQQWITLQLARRIEKLTYGEVPWRAWPQVRDRDGGKWWRYGARSDGPWKERRAA